MQFLAAVPKGAFSTNKLQTRGAGKVCALTRFPEFASTEDSDARVQRGNKRAFVQQEMRFAAFGAKATLALEEVHAPFSRGFFELALLAIFAGPEHALARVLFRGLHFSLLK